MKSFLLFIFLLSGYLSYTQSLPAETKVGCYELVISCYATDCKFGFSENVQQTPPTPIKLVKKNQRITIYGIFGLDIKYIDKEYRVDPTKMSVTRSLKEIEGIVACSNNYNPSQRGMLRDMIKKELVFAEVKYNLFECE